MPADRSASGPTSPPAPQPSAKGAASNGRSATSTPARSTRSSTSGSRSMLLRYGSDSWTITEGSEGEGQDDPEAHHDDDQRDGHPPGDVGAECQAGDAPPRADQRDPEEHHAGEQEEHAPRKSPGASLPIADAVQHRGGQEAGHRDDRGHQRQAVGAPAPHVELVEAL